MARKCLMIETKDRRRFFTDPHNYDHLVEFGKTFGAELSVVRAEEPDILDLMSLAPAICDTSYEVVNRPVFEVVEVKLPKMQRQRKTLLRQADTVKKWIENQLLEGNSVKLAEVRKRYKRYGLTMQAFCNHLADVRKKLTAEGHELERVGHGEYKIVQYSADTKPPHGRQYSEEAK